MKKFILFILLIIPCIANSQNYNWIQPNRDYIKMYITADGIYRINKSDFTAAGINPDNIDPRTIKVLNKGIQIPIYFYGEQDGVFNDTDWFDFFGQRNYGGISNVYQENGGTMNVIYTVNEYYNQYSDTNVYWLDWGGIYGLRMQDISISAQVNYPDNYFYSSMHFEKDLVYSMGEKINLYDYRNFNNERIQGEGWYWKELQRGNSISDTATMKSLYTGGANCRIKIFAYPNSYTDTIYNEHYLIFRSNSNNVDTFKTDNYNRIDTTIAFPVSALNGSGVNQFQFIYTNPGLYYGRMYFDMFNIYYPRKFEFDNGRLYFESSYQDTSLCIYKVKGYTTAKPLAIYDVKNGQRIASFSLNLDTLIFSAKKNANVYVINDNFQTKPLRMKVKRVPDFLSSSNGCDYLIIYNNLFVSQAEQLRQHRASFNNFRTYKAEVEDLYDVFNYGLENPVALKNFTKYVYSNWQSPTFQYLCLFGRGSLDPKQNVVPSQYYINYVPVYGNPATDGYYANFVNGAYTYYPQVRVGRLPVYTQQEASDVVNKIVSYDNTQRSSWVKNFIFITGGQNLQEQISFAGQSNYLIDNYIKPVPLTSAYERIYRADTSGYVTYYYQDSIIHAIDDGGLIVNYIGHAATNVWDNGLSDPSVLNNGVKLPIVFSMTCFTGKNAETGTRSFGENFFIEPGKGAINFVGTTGWSYSLSGNLFNSYLFEAVSTMGLRRAGDMMKYASDKLVQDSSSSSTRNTINCYNLLGDPATALLLSTNPDFDVQLSDYSLSNPYPSLKETVTLNLYPKNLGTYADSCKIRFQLLKSFSASKTYDTVIKYFGFIDTVHYLFKIDSAGSYTMKVILDPDNWYPTDPKSNNTITFPITLKNISYVPLKPIDNQLVAGDSVEFTGINPSVDVRTSSVRLLLSIDTSANFNSPLQQLYFKPQLSGIDTKFKIRLPINDTNAVFYWRMNSIVNGIDTSGWSETRKFVYSPTAYQRKIFSDSSVIVKMKNLGQYSSLDYSGITQDSSGIVLKNYTGNLIAQSWGVNYFDASYFVSNQTQVFLIDSAGLSGLHLAKVRKLDGRITEVRHFWFSSQLSNDSLVGYLGNFDTNYVLMMTKAYPNSQTINMNTQSRAALRRFGSIYADSINLQSLSRWSFISYRGYPTPLNVEDYKTTSNWIPSQSVMNPIFKSTSGILSSLFGISDFRKNVAMNYLLPPGTNLTFDLYGVRQDASQILLRQNLSGIYNINLDTLDAMTYPMIKLNTKFGVDTNFMKMNFNNYASPILTAISGTYIPPAEVCPDVNSFQVSDTILQEGDSLRLTLKFYNIGFRGVTGFVSSWQASSPSGIVTLKTDTVRQYIAVDSNYTSTALLRTSGLRNPFNKADTVYFYYNVSLLNQNEFYTYNNTAITKVVITGDTVKPVLDVTIDGTTARTGDYIASKPNIIIKFFDNNHEFIKDTSNIKIRLDNVYVPYYIGAEKNPQIDIRFMTDKYLQAIVFYNPVLEEGEHTFNFISVDYAGNRSDTVTYELYVNSQFRVADLYNYPNPMRNITSFMYNLSGEAPPTDAYIKIYTVAGRLIKTINHVSNIGFNRIDWDGRDDDGDAIANGVYFYKLIVKGNSQIDSKIQKLVVLK